MKQIVVDRTKLRHSIKQLILLLLSFTFFSCNQKEQQQNQNLQNENIQNINMKFGKELIENDFLKYAVNSKIDSMKIRLMKSFDIYNQDIFKVAHIDAEELAEFNFDFFLPQLNLILEKRNLNLNVKTANNYEKTNDIIINGEKLNLYTKDELENSTFWDKASGNFFKKVNEILKSKKIDEQFCLLYNGNDLHTILLTDKQFAIISEYYKDKPLEKPYKP